MTHSRRERVMGRDPTYSRRERVVGLDLLIEVRHPLPLYILIYKDVGARNRFGNLTETDESL